MPTHTHVRTTDTSGPVPHHHSFATGSRWTPSLNNDPNHPLDGHFHLLRDTSDPDTYTTSGPLDASRTPIDSHTHTWARR